VKLSTKLSSAGNYDIIAVNLLPRQFEILCLQHESCLYVWCLSISWLTIQCLRDAEHWMFPTATVRWTCSLQTAAVHWPASTWWVEPGRQCNVPQMTSQTYNNNSVHSYCHCLTWTDQTQDRTSTRRFDDRQHAVCHWSRLKACLSMTSISALKLQSYLITYYFASCLVLFTLGLRLTKTEPFAIYRAVFQAKAVRRSIEVELMTINTITVITRCHPNGM